MTEAFKTACCPQRNYQGINDNDQNICCICISEPQMAYMSMKLDERCLRKIAGTLKHTTNSSCSLSTCFVGIFHSCSCMVSVCNSFSITTECRKLGWKFEKSVYIPNWTELQEASEAECELVKCGCKPEKGCPG